VSLCRASTEFYIHTGGNVAEISVQPVYVGVDAKVIVSLGMIEIFQYSTLYTALYNYRFPVRQLDELIISLHSKEKLPKDWGVAVNIVFEYPLLNGRTTSSMLGCYLRSPND